MALNDILMLPFVGSVPLLNCTKHFLDPDFTIPRPKKNTNVKFQCLPGLMSHCAPLR